MPVKFDGYQRKLRRISIAADRLILWVLDFDPELWVLHVEPPVGAELVPLHRNELAIELGFMLWTYPNDEVCRVYCSSWRRLSVVWSVLGSLGDYGE